MGFQLSFFNKVTGAFFLGGVGGGGGGGGPAARISFVTGIKDVGGAPPIADNDVPP